MNRNKRRSRGMKRPLNTEAVSLPDPQNVTPATPTVPEHATNPPEVDKESSAKWRIPLKAIFAIVTAILIPGIALVLTHADSDLRSVERRDRPMAINDYKFTDSTMTVMVILYHTFTNKGLRTDYINDVEIRPVYLDASLKSEAKFVDRRPIKWRQTRELRVEVLVTFNRQSLRWHDFQVVFYDSRHRQVGQTFLTVRLGSPGDLAPRSKASKYVGGDTWVSASTDPPPPVLLAASLTLHAKDGYPNSSVVVAAQLLSESKEIVAETIPTATVHKPDGSITCVFEVESRILKNDLLFLRLFTTPPPTRPVGSIQWSFWWADRTYSGMSLWTSEVPTEPEWYDFRVNPIVPGLDPHSP
jgi:hypothetical protein